MLDVTRRNALRINPAKTCQPIGAMYAALGIHSACRTATARRAAAPITAAT
jgi:nitrogenase molybdenum-iron protein alpha/beta subunit